MKVFCSILWSKLILVTGNNWCSIRITIYTISKFCVWPNPTKMDNFSVSFFAKLIHDLVTTALTLLKTQRQRSSCKRSLIRATKFVSVDWLNSIKGLNTETLWETFSTKFSTHYSQEKLTDCNNQLLLPFPSRWKYQNMLNWDGGSFSSSKLNFWFIECN